MQRAEFIQRMLKKTAQLDILSLWPENKNILDADFLLLGVCAYACMCVLGLH